MRGFFSIPLIQAVPLAAAAVSLLLMYAQGSFVSRYTLHGLSKRIFLHYYGVAVPRFAVFITRQCMIQMRKYLLREYNDTGKTDVSISVI